MNNVVQFPRAFRPRLVASWRPSAGDLVETIGHCAKVLRVEGCVVEVEIKTPLREWTTWVHVSQMKPWREPMTRMADVFADWRDSPCDQNPEPPRVA